MLSIITTVLAPYLHCREMYGGVECVKGCSDSSVVLVLMIIISYIYLFVGVVCVVVFIYSFVMLSTCRCLCYLWKIQLPIITIPLVY